MLSTTLEECGIPFHNEWHAPVPLTTVPASIYPCVYHMQPPTRRLSTLMGNGGTRTRKTEVPLSGQGGRFGFPHATQRLDGRRTIIISSSFLCVQEATDVRVWKGADELATALRDLTEQPSSWVESVMVQVHRWGCSCCGACGQCCVAFFGFTVAVILDARMPASPGSAFCHTPFPPLAMCGGGGWLTLSLRGTTNASQPGNMR